MYFLRDFGSLKELYRDNKKQRLTYTSIHFYLWKKLHFKLINYIVSLEWFCFIQFGTNFLIILQIKQFLYNLKNFPRIKTKCNCSILNFEAFNNTKYMYTCKMVSFPSRFLSIRLFIKKNVNS